jgi:DNA-binding response OmpR family regulator
VSDGPSVLVVDDEPDVRDALERALRLEGFAVRTAVDGVDALAELDVAPPAIAVIDVAMPRLDGVSLIRRMRADGCAIPVCVLSARTEVEDRVRGLQAGADDYLVKPFALDELVARLHALLRRRPDSPAPRTLGDLYVDGVRREVRRGERALDLTRREFDLLEVFMRHPGVVLSRVQLLELVWGYTFEVESNVVDVFVGYLRRKLEEQGEPRMLRTVRGVGFVLRA